MIRQHNLVPSQKNIEAKKGSDQNGPELFNLPCENRLEMDLAMLERWREDYNFV